MSEVVIYHNPRCSKSRAACALLAERGVEPQVIEYLKTPPDAEELRALVAALGISASELVRRGEKVFKEKYRGRDMEEDDWIAAMVADPILIERPIAVIGARAVIGRPPERVLALLSDAG